MYFSIHNGETKQWGEFMRIGVIQASSQSGKNELLYCCTCKAVERNSRNDEVINSGVFRDENVTFTYVETAVNISLLLASGTVDFIVTGCSSGQGMMLACNNVPGVLCGYVPTPMDAYLFAQINDGNAVSVPLGEEYTWQGKENLEQTVEKLFSEPFGQGYPKSEAERKKKDTLLLKEIRKNSQVSISEFLAALPKDLVEKIRTKENVLTWIRENGKDPDILAWLR